MSEPMVRIVSRWCPIHGSRDAVPFVEPGVGRNMDLILPAATLREKSAICVACRAHGVRTQVFFATEPVDLEPREEQAG